ncbi:MAG: hypothetical protein QXI12_12015, partial [Candidatus Methanomethyliaceae archaeon]
MSKIKVGILTFSDGREGVHAQVHSVCQRFQNLLEQKLRDTGEVEPIVAPEIVGSSESALAQSKLLTLRGCEVTIFNFAVWSFPHFAILAAQFAPRPILLFSNINPEYPGMVGMLATAGGLDQIGIFHGRLSGDIGDSQVLRKVLAFLRAGAAVN